jgi:antigen flippase
MALVTITASAGETRSSCSCVTAPFLDTPLLTEVCSDEPILQQGSHPIEAPGKGRSYGQILKSSALVGGSQVVNIAIGIVRTKAMAILLGPAGFGLFGLYGSIADLTQSIAGLGINSSGVRQIAEASATGDTTQMARTAAVLRRISLVLGILGAAFLLCFSRLVSRVTFGSADHAAAVAILSIAVLFRLISAGQGALIQGNRRIADLARMSILSALFGLLSSIPLVYFFRDNGVVPSLVVVAAAMILTSWWYSRKITLPSAVVTLSQVRREASAFLKLGSAFMASGFLTMGAAYVIRITVLHKVGSEAMGLYQSAWMLGGFYVGIVLQAMGADFYPRLTASIKDHVESNRLVNEQTLIGILVAGPGVLATLTFAPLVISLLYSARFGGAVGVLRWICLGATLQVITWPMGFIIIAKGKQGFFIFSEVAWTIVAIALAWLCVTRYGVNGAGIAFFLSYVFHGVVTYPIVSYLTGFRWSAENKRQGAIFFLLIAAVFGSFYLLPLAWAAGLSCLAALASAVYSVRMILKLVSPGQVPRQLRRLFAGTKLSPSAL